MRKVTVFAFLSIFSLLVIIPLLLINRLTQNEIHYKTVKLSGMTIKAEIADTPLKQTVGLMSKKTLPLNGGMLFIFNEEKHHGIWMRNMSFPIDIVWINKNLEIVDIVESAQPCRINCPIYLPDEKASYVLEVNAGFSKKNQLQIGDMISIS